MGKVSAVDLCQQLKDEAEVNRNNSPINELRLRILDYLIACRVPDNKFEAVLKGRINDPDPAKKYSKAICGEILAAWHNQP